MSDEQIDVPEGWSIAHYEEGVTDLPLYSRETDGGSQYIHINHGRFELRQQGYSGVLYSSPELGYVRTYADQLTHKYDLRIDDRKIEDVIVDVAQLVDFATDGVSTDDKKLAEASLIFLHRAELAIDSIRRRIISRNPDVTFFAQQERIAQRMKLAVQAVYQCIWNSCPDMAGAEFIEMDRIQVSLEDAVSEVIKNRSEKKATMS